MLRGHRSIILAVVGWLALAAANNGQIPQPSNRAEQQQPSAQIEQAANTIATAIRNSQESPERDTGCEDRKDRRSSDLCAQWKAADAARDAAKYAGWSLFIGIVGTFFLMWTLWETRSTARRELRAYVSVHPTTLKVVDDGEGGIEAGIKMRNGGATPAYDCIHAGNIVALPDENLARFFQGVRDAPRLGPRAPVVLHGHQEMNGSISSTVEFDKAKLMAVNAGSLGLYAYGFVEYRDAFNCLRMSRFCYRALGTVWVEGAEDGAERPLRWELMPFHNDAD